MNPSHSMERVSTAMLPAMDGAYAIRKTLTVPTVVISIVLRLRNAEIVHIFKDYSPPCWIHSLRGHRLPIRVAEMYALYPTSSIFAPWLLAAGLVSGHMFISSPRPIDETAVKEPLSPNGDDFPCHGASLPTAGGMRMLAGSTQSLDFDTGGGANTAVHGGGSCQISITYESDPALLKDPQNWRVLYSIQGGCPSNTHLNLDGVFTSPDGVYQGSWPCTNGSTNGIDCTNSFEFKIRED